MRVEPQGLEAYLGCMDVEKSGNMVAAHALGCVDAVVGADGSV